MLIHQPGLRVLIAALVLGTADSVPAATEYTDTVPAELARYFAGGGRIFQGLPEGFETLRLPPALEALGSLDQGSMQQVIFRSAGDPGVAASSLAQTFTEQGWLLQTGGDAEALSLCHNQRGQMRISGQAQGGENRVFLTRHTTPCGQAPDQQAAAALSGPALTPEMREWLPSLSPPENLAQDFEMTPFRRVPGSPDEIEAQADIVIDRSVGEVYGWFVQQLRNQGWRPDAEWYGQLSAGGNWLRSRDNGQQVIGTLQLLQMADNRFEMSIRLRQRN